jgi:hypothetical protein
MEVRLHVSARCLELLFSSDGSCFAFQLQLCLVSSSPSKMGQFSFECYPLSQGSSYRIHSCPVWEVRLLPHPCSQPLCFSWSLLGASGSFERLACHLVPTLSLGCFTQISSLTVWYWEFDSSPHPRFLEQVQCSTLTSAVGIRLQLTVYIFHSSQGLLCIIFPRGG